MSRGVRKLTPLHMCCMLGNTTVIIKNVSQNYSDFLTFISLRNEKHYENDNQAERYIFSLSLSLSLQIIENIEYLKQLNTIFSLVQILEVLTVR
jgi:hypothetical protein